MNRIFKKNQLIITSLAIMIAVAGYLNFSGEEISMVSDNKETMVQSVNDEMDIPEGEIGEAVLTSASIESFVADAKLNREQTHAKAKESLEAIINNSTIDKAQKQDAIDQMAKLSDRMAKQTAAEEREQRLLQGMKKLPFMEMQMRPMSYRNFLLRLKGFWLLQKAAVM